MYSTHIVYVINSQGRVLNSLKYPGLRLDSISSQTIAVSNDTVVIRDHKDHKGEWGGERKGKWEREGNMRE